MDVAVALDMPTTSLRLQLVMTDVVEDVLAVAVGNDSGSACVWLKQLTLHSATRFQHSLFMIQALQLVH